MAQQRVSSGVPSGGEFAVARKQEAPVALADEGPHLEFGKQYILTYEVDGEDGTEERTVEIVYSGDRGPFITSDDGSMVRRGAVIEVESNDPYEKAVAAAEAAITELREARKDKVSNLIRTQVNNVRAISFEFDQDDGVSLGSVMVPRQPAQPFHDMFDAETEGSVGHYLGELAETERLEPGIYSMTLSSGKIKRMD